MTLVKYYGIRGMNHPRDPQSGRQHHQKEHKIDFIRKVGKLTILSFDRSSKCTAGAGVKKLDMYYKLNQMIDMEASDSFTFEG
jgi:hypothetical protein